MVFSFSYFIYFLVNPAYNVFKLEINMERTMDIALIRLQYEILNTPLEVLAEMSGLSVSSLEFESREDRGNWKQLWPDQPILVDGQTPDFDEYADMYIANTKKRLKVFSLAKDVYFLAKYADIESTILDKVKDLADEAKELKELNYAASVFKSVMSGTNLATVLQKMEDNDLGIPLLTIRDMSGTNRQQA